MTERLIYELRVVENPGGVWFETIYPEDRKRTRISGITCDRRAMHPAWYGLKDRSRRRMRKSLDFLEGLYNDLYGNVEK